MLSYGSLKSQIWMCVEAWFCKIQPHVQIVDRWGGMFVPEATEKVSIKTMEHCEKRGI